MKRLVITAAIAFAGINISTTAFADETVEATEVSPAVEQLRHTIGNWDVETDFIGADGKIQGTLAGTYSFSWVLEDKIVSGVSVIPKLKQTSAMLFFHRAKEKEIEMASVGADGQLWRMIGPDNSETRTTPNITNPDGSNVMLRFTRHSVKPDSFGSTMELSSDGGKTWRIGNQQRFTRAKPLEP